VTILCPTYARLECDNFVSHRASTSAGNDVDTGIGAGVAAAH
jgi:hypothetical protein